MGQRKEIRISLPFSVSDLLDKQGTSAPGWVILHFAFTATVTRVFTG